MSPFTFYNKFTGTEGGSNIFLVIVLIFAALKSFVAVKYLKKYPEEVRVTESGKWEKWGNKVFPWLSWVSLVWLIYVFITILMGQDGA